MFTVIQKVVFLKSVSIFGEASSESLAALAMVLQEADVKAGTEIISKGSLGTTLFIVARGRVRVHDGERELASLGEKEVFGELSALVTEQRSASVTAAADSTVFMLEQSALFSMMQENPDIMQGIVTVLVRRMRNLLSLVPVKEDDGEEERAAEARATGRMVYW